MDELAMLLEGMTPEQQAQLLGLGAIDEEQALLQQQMQMADQLRQGSGQQYSTPMGAAFGGLGNAVGNIAGAAQQKGIMGEMEGNVADRVTGRGGFTDAMVKALRARRAGTMDSLTSPGMGVIAPIPGGM